MRLKSCSMSDFLSLIKDKKVICFGFGFQSWDMCNNYKQILDRIVFFIDGDKSKVGTHIIGGKEIEVKPKEWLLQNKDLKDYAFLITTKFVNEIVEEFDYLDVDVYSYILMEELLEKEASTDCDIFKSSDESIPRVIHYCWFGNGKKSELHEKCIASWKEKCPDYEIIEWNESNFDININNYVKEAYEAKKYAFVSDFLRLYVLYNYGGIYLDVDVEVLKPLDELLFVDGFTGFETTHCIPTGIIATKKGNIWVKEQLDFYENNKFLDEKNNQILTTNVEIITNISKEKHGFIPNGKFQELRYGMCIYPKCFFCPKSVRTGNIYLTNRTYTIHHFNLSWMGETTKDRNERLSNYLKGFI